MCVAAQVTVVMGSLLFTLSVVTAFVFFASAGYVCDWCAASLAGAGHVCDGRVERRRPRLCYGRAEWRAPARGRAWLGIGWTTRGCSTVARARGWLPARSLGMWAGAVGG